jgi:16S rRNA (cytosine967-C5)-methyltransferase
VTVAKKLCQRAPAFLRVNIRKTTIEKAQKILSGDGIQTVKHPSIITALRVTEGQNKIKNCMAYKDGFVEIQDASSQASVIDLPRDSNLKILDYCCGSGGKSLALDAWTEGKIFAYDISPDRSFNLKTRAERSNAQITKISKPIKEMFDVIFCDVPCSGSGSWRRDPDGKWKLNAHSWQNLLNTQIEVLNEAKQLLKTDGILIYATCSVLLSENYKQLEKFCSLNPEFEIKKAHQFLPSDLGDGFFYGFLKKK